MTDLLTTLSLLGYCILIRRLTRWPIEAIPFFLVSVVIVLFYGFALQGVLTQGSAFFIILGALCLCAAPFYLPQKKSALFTEYLTPGFTLFIFYLIIFGITAHFLTISDWDEFARWLPNAKMLYLNHGLWTRTDTLASKDYPPGGALFYFLFLRFGEFTEGRLYFAQLFLTLAPITLLFSNTQWRERYTVFIIYTLILFVGIAFLSFKLGTSATLYMDNVTGLFFGGIIASYFIMNNQRYLWLYLLAPLAALPLLRPLLSPFTAIIAAIILSDQFYLKWRHDTTLKAITLFLMTLVLSLLPSFWWQHYLTHELAIAPQWHLNTLFSALLHSLSSSTKITSVLTLYLKALIAPLAFLFAIAWVIRWLYFHINDVQLRQRFLLSQLILIAGFISYIVLLVFIYLYMMSPEIRNTLNSFNRFINIYYVGWLLILLSQSFYFCNKPLIAKMLLVSSKQKKVLSGFQLIILILYLGYGMYSKNEKDQQTDSMVYLRHTLMQQLIQPVRAVTPQDANVGILWQGWGLIPYMISTDLLPQHSYFMTGNTMENLTPKLASLNYLLVGGKAHVVIKNSSAFAILSLCTDANFDNINNKHCQFRNVPFYLYKITVKNGKLMLVPVTNHVST